MENSKQMAFSEEIIQKVWEKAKPIPGYNANSFRKDACGAIISYNDHDNSGTYGWVVDHIIPENVGGDTELSNLQPLHWKNHESKAKNYPNWLCVVKS